MSTSDSEIVEDRKTQRLLEKGLYRINKQCEIRTDHFHYTPVRTIVWGEFDMTNDIVDFPTIYHEPLVLTNLTNFAIEETQLEIEDMTEDTDLFSNTFIINYSVSTPIAMIITIIISFYVSKWYTDKFIRRMELEVKKRPIQDEEA